MTDNRKPLGIKSYGHIAHLPGSRLGPGDHKCHEGQARIATEKTRDRHDHIIVQEKVDGSNVGVALKDGVIYPLTRAGYVATTSPYEQHIHFANWVYANQDRFLAVLQEGERVCGEWLMQAHGTRYNLPHEPFVVFDLMKGAKRTPFDEFLERIKLGEFVIPHILHRGEPLGIEAAMAKLKTYGFHGSIDPVEGAVWRVERNRLIHPGKGSERKWTVDFLVKFVRPDKEDGIYLPEVSGQKAVWNWWPVSKTTDPRALPRFQKEKLVP
jgi:hypothetical protein